MQAYFSGFYSQFDGKAWRRVIFLALAIGVFVSGKHGIRLLACCRVSRRNWVVLGNHKLGVLSSLGI